MLALGWAVGRASTPLDSWFARNASHVIGGQPRWLLVFTSGWLAVSVLTISVAVALRRRQWRLAAAVIACPLVAVAGTAGLKRWFDRRNGPYLEYPSGHTVLLVVVLGMMVVVAGRRVWLVGVAALVAVLGALGLVGCGYHYLTDTVGAGLFAAALVGIAARLADSPRPGRLTSRL